MHASSTASKEHLLIRGDGPANPVPPGWEERSLTLEELTMAYLRGSGAAALPGPARDSGADPSEMTRSPR